MGSHTFSSSSPTRPLPVSPPGLRLGHSSHPHPDPANQNGSGPGLQLGFHLTSPLMEPDTVPVHEDPFRHHHVLLRATSKVCLPLQATNGKYELLPPHPDEMVLTDEPTLTPNPAMTTMAAQILALTELVKQLQIDLAAIKAILTSLLARPSQVAQTAAPHAITTSAKKQNSAAHAQPPKKSLATVAAGGSKPPTNAWQRVKNKEPKKAPLITPVSTQVNHEIIVKLVSLISPTLTNDAILSAANEARPTPGIRFVLASLSNQASILLTTTLSVSAS